MSVNYKSAYTIQAVDRALCILEAISQEDGAFGISDLSNKLGLNKNYIFRTLATLEQRGYVRHADPPGYYQAGLTAYETGGRFLHQMELLQKAKPLMQRLAHLSKEAIYLAIPGEVDFLFLEMVDSSQQVRVMPLVGRRFALNQFSAGKVLLAHNHSLAESLPGNPPAGACVDYGAVADGIGCLAVPIFNAQAAACASLCILAPEYRLSSERIEMELLPLLQGAAEEVSAKLGHFRAELRKMCG